MILPANAPCSFVNYTSRRFLFDARLRVVSQRERGQAPLPFTAELLALEMGSRPGPTINDTNYQRPGHGHYDAPVEDDRGRRNRWH
jgi:hypothetical protein